MVRRKFRPRVPRQGILGNLPRVYKMRYVDWFNLSPSSGALTYYTFRANGIYDPNKSGTGHQPFLHDTLSTLWTSYVVLGSKINFTVLGVIADANSAGAVATGVILDDDDTISSDYTGIIEQGLGRHRITNSRADTTPRTVIGKYSAKRFFGVKDVKDNQSSIGAKFGFDPVSQAYFVCWAQPLTISGASSLNCRVVIDYIVHVSEPKTLAQS